ncbi:MAG: FG-GAP-like repeat-containing protein, partial [Myxococcota bacterium]|nr:FG-GAP-like repeat-containing protein [Myxococcota bacterium]
MKLLHRSLRRCAPLAVCVSLLGSPSMALAVLGPAPGSVTAETLTLPTTPGSLQGAGDELALEAFSGQAQHQVTIELPAGRAGVAPLLTLRYDGNLGDGPLGPGWTLDVPQIRRSVRRGVPSYTAADTLELVGVPGANGRLLPLEDGTYRVLGQGDRLRVLPRDGGFRMLTPDGGLWLFGATEATRQTTVRGDFAWLAGAYEHPTGQVIRYTYQQLDGHAYLAQITYPLERKVQLSYLPRESALFRHRAGMPQRWSQTLSQLDVRVRGQRYSRWQLDYERTNQTPRLASVQRFGQTDATRRPPRRFSYREPVAPSSISSFAGAPFALSNPNVTLTDVDGDGLVDLVNLRGADAQWARNAGDRFEPPQALEGPDETLASGRLRLMDINGDARADLLVQRGVWIPWLNQGAGYREHTPIDGSDGLSLGGAQVFADLDGDGIAELLRSSGNGLAIFQGEAGALGEERLVDLPPELSGYSLQDARLRIQDITGDGLADFIVLEPTHFTLFEGLGDGGVTAGVRQELPRQIVDYGASYFRDLDRDGCVDFVLFVDASVFWFPRRPDGTFAAARQIAAPSGADNTSRIHLGDLNGNGTLDVIWSQNQQVWVMELVGDASRGLLEVIDNGLGRSQMIRYTSTRSLAAMASRAGSPWSRQLATILPVVSRIETRFADVHTAPREKLVVVADPIWDHEERSFAGFGQVTTRQLSASTRETLVTQTQLAPGLGEARPLRGRTLTIERRDADGRRFDRVTHDWQLRRPEALAAQPLAARAVNVATVRQVYEGAEEPLTLRTTRLFNEQGDALELRHLGVEDRSGDEQIVRMRYLYLTGAYHLWGAQTERSVHALNDELVAKTRYLYDGAMEPLPHGEATRGWLRQELGWLESEQRWVLRRAFDYDEHGNVTRRYRGGVWRRIDYDADGLFAIAEHVAPNPERTLSVRAQWDPTLGTLERLIDAAGVEHVFGYDGLGRLTTRALMGQNPHLTIDYTLLSPLPTVTRRLIDGEAGTIVEHQRYNGGSELVARITELGPSRRIVSQYTRRNARGLAATTCEAFYMTSPEIPEQLPQRTPCAQHRFDAQGRPLTSTDARSIETQWSYRALESTSQTGGMSAELRRRDGLDRPSVTRRTVEGVDQEAQAEYDAAGRLRRLELNQGQASHTFGYDTLGRLLEAEDPDQGRRAHTYDDHDRIVTTQNAAGETISYRYDDAGRLLSESGSRGTQRSYHYDAPRAGTQGGREAGRLAWVEEPTGTIAFGYDAFGRVQSQRRFIAGQEAHERRTYSPSGRLLMHTFGGGPTVDYGYDLGGRLVRAAPFWEAIELDAAGRPLKEEFQNGVRHDNERDGLGFLIAQVIARGETTLSDLAIERNARGATTQITDRLATGMDHNQRFTYDPGHRLRAATVAGRTIELTYDALGNLTARRVDGAPPEGLVTGAFRYQEAHPRQLVQAGEVTLAYDAAGRATEVGDRRLTWDAFDRLIATERDGQTETHRYGLGGLRTLTDRADGRTERWFSEHHLRLGAMDHFYVEVNGRRVVRVRQVAPEQAAQAPVSPPWLPLLLALLTLWASRPRQARPAWARTAAAGGILISLGACACAPTEAPGVFYLHRSHAVGPTLITDQAGTLVDERRFAPYGHRL